MEKKQLACSQFQNTCILQSSDPLCSILLTLSLMHNFCIENIIQQKLRANAVNLIFGKFQSTPSNNDKGKTLIRFGGNKTPEADPNASDA